MANVVTNKAEIEYAVMLAVLNFHTEFMKTKYSRAQVQVFDELIEVTLTKTVSIPAEDELPRSAGGRSPLCQSHQAIFDSYQGFLCKRIEDAIGAKVRNLIADFDSSAGSTTIIVRLQEPLVPLASCQSVG
jgi:uncharacterized protein YbcI